MSSKKWKLGSAIHRGPSVVYPTAPSQVSGLQLYNAGTTDSLHARWERAPGDLDSYRVLLVHDSSVIKNESVGPDTNSLSFPGLRPGALYGVVVTTVRSAQLSRQAVAEGRTGESLGRGAEGGAARGTTGIGLLLDLTRRFCLFLVLLLLLLLKDYIT